MKTRPAFKIASVIMMVTGLGFFSCTSSRDRDTPPPGDRGHDPASACITVRGPIRLVKAMQIVMALVEEIRPTAGGAYYVPMLENDSIHCISFDSEDIKNFLLLRDEYVLSSTMNLTEMIRVFLDGTGLYLFSQRSDLNQGPRTRWYHVIGRDDGEK